MVGVDPILFFNKWFQEALHAQVLEPNAMTLATVDANGFPKARIVLLKGVDARGFVFYTNYLSAKGRELAASGRAALVFFWPELERQVRIEGSVSQVSSTESDAYFHSRPLGSQLGAWASPQSEVIESRETLEQYFQRTEQAYTNREIPRPEHWGGYLVSPFAVEFWQGRRSRMHDRIRFIHPVKEGEPWQKQRLAP